MNIEESKVKIILVQPTYPTSPMPGPHLPVGLGYLAEQLELNGIEYEVSDLYIDDKDLLFEKIKELRPDYIGISLMSLDIFYNYALIKDIKVKFPKVKIIAGGPHISFIKGKALLECSAIDFGVVHEGEETLIELLNGLDVKEIKGLIYRDNLGNIVYNGNRGFIEDLDKLPFPKYNKFDLPKYGKTISIASSRGCPFSCIFCGAFLSMGKKWRARDASNIIEEILYWYNKGYTNFNFVDSNFFLSKRRIIDLCDFLEKEKIDINMTSEGFRAIDANYEMLNKMKRFGLKSVAVGIESANEEILQNIKKGETLHDIKKCLEILKGLDIAVVAFLIIGLPGETRKHVLNSFKFTFKYSNIKSVYFFNSNPLPGTELYQWAEKNNFLRAKEVQHIYYNIGGMGKDILIETPELSLKEREILYMLSKVISKLVRLRYETHRIFRVIGLNRLINITNVCLKRAKVLSKLWPKCIDIILTGHKWCFNIFTHLTKIERLVLYKLALSSPNKCTIVEIGSYLGGSSTFLALAAKRKQGMLYCVDTWKNEGMSEGQRDTFDEFLKNIEPLRDYIRILRGNSVDVANTFNENIDLLFIDGDHSYEAVKADMEYWLPKVKNHGIVIFHDIGWAEGVIRVVNEIIKPIQIEEHIVDNTYWAKIRK